VSLGGYSFPNDEASEVTPTTQNPSTALKANAPSHKRSCFPSQLHEMVTYSNMESIMSWLPHGRGFMVHDTEKFVSEVLPNYFNHSRFASFQRQLNSYGFRRFTQGRDAGAYYHESFLRGRPYLCANIYRMREKLEPLGPGQEINFYALPFIDHEGMEMPINPQLPPVPAAAPRKHIRRRSSRKWIVTEESKRDRKDNLPSFTALQDWKDILRDEVAKSGTPVENVGSKVFPSREDIKSKEFPVDDKMPKKLPVHILPLSDHPLDQTTFFIPLDMLLLDHRNEDDL